MKMLAMCWSALIIMYIVAMKLRTRKDNFKWVEEFINILVYILVFIMGIRMGANKEIVDSLGTIGVQAIIVTLITVAFSILGVTGVRMILRMDRYVSGVDTNTDLRASGDFEDSGALSDDDGYLDVPEYEQEPVEEYVEEPRPEPRIHTSFYVPDDSEVHDDIHEITFNNSANETAIKPQENPSVSGREITVNNHPVTPDSFREKSEIYADGDYG